MASKREISLPLGSQSPEVYQWKESLRNSNSKGILLLLVFYLRRLSPYSLRPQAQPRLSGLGLVVPTTQLSMSVVIASILLGNICSTATCTAAILIMILLYLSEGLWIQYTVQASILLVQLLQYTIPQSVSVLQSGVNMSRRTNYDLFLLLGVS